MLLELHVRDLGVISDLSIVLDRGMTALTGETGAGKTLVVEAIELLVGGRADPMLVGPGAEEASVEGRFVDGDDEIVLGRVVPRSGRSRAYVDGRLATVAELAGRGRACIEQALADARGELRYARDRLVARSPLAQIAAHRQAIGDNVERSHAAAVAQLRMLREQVEGRRLQLGALSPRATLARGYGIVSRRGDGVVRSVGEVGPAQPLSIQVADGEIDATVDAVRGDVG